jgi:hypothetical protein
MGPLATAPVTVAGGPVKLPWVTVSAGKSLMRGWAGSEIPGIAEAGVLANEAAEEIASELSVGC